MSQTVWGVAWIKVFACVGLLCCTTASRAATYPPYPDRWHWLPRGISAEYRSPDLRPMPNGDVLITVLGPTNEDASFFGREHFESTQAGLGGGPVSIGARHSVQRADGRWVVAIAQGDCMRGLGSSLNLHDSQGATIRGSSFVFASDDDKEFESYTCEEVERPGFTSKVVVLEPTDVVELKDGSLLMAERRVGLVLRVRMASDGTVCTKSELLGKTLFIVDSQWVGERFRSFTRSHIHVDSDFWPAFFEKLGRELRKTEKLQGRC